MSNDEQLIAKVTELLTRNGLSPARGTMTSGFSVATWDGGSVSVTLLKGSETSEQSFTVIARSWLPNCAAALKQYPGYEALPEYHDCGMRHQLHVCIKPKR